MFIESRLCTQFHLSLDVTSVPVQRFSDYFHPHLFLDEEMQGLLQTHDHSLRPFLSPSHHEQCTSEAAGSKVIFKEATEA